MKLSIYCGPAWRSWNPRIAIETGDGGAHMALVDLCPRLVKRGWDVTVYAQSEGDDAGTFDGVTWKHFQDGFEQDSSELLIAWRRPEAIRSAHRAKARLFMARDMHYGSAITRGDSEKVDCFAVLSKWQKRYWLSHYPWCIGKVWTTRNGVDASRFECNGPRLERNRFKACYTSAPYRGLGVALKAWPLVRQRIPTAELHVFYGFETSEKMAHARKSQPFAASLAGLRERIDSTEGVVNHGRTSRAGIDRALMSAHVWLYPSTFMETSCAAVMEASVAGCSVVTNDLAALGETGRFGRQLSERAGTSEYAEAVIRAMTSDAPDPSAPRAAFDIEALADEWDSKFRELIR